jgi:phosphoinositide-3-kinase regulatory subunit 4
LLPNFSLVDFLQMLIKQMITLDHTVRPTFDTVLHTSRGTVFPECFYSFLHNYVHSVCELSEKNPFIASPALTTTGTPTTTPVTHIPKPAQRAPISMSQELHGDDNLPSDSDHRMERIWSDYESVETYLEQNTSEGSPTNGKVESLKTAPPTSIPLQVCFPSVGFSFLKRFLGRIPCGTEHSQP